MSFRRLALPLVALLAAVPAVGEPPARPLTPAEAKKRDAVQRFLEAKLHAQESEFEDALKDFRKAVELDPQDAALRAEFAELLRDLSILPEAEKEARKAVELAPANPAALRVLGQVLLATAKDKPGYEAAADVLRKANEALPGDSQTAVSYAQILLRLDRPADAAAVLERVLEKSRGPGMFLMYGEALAEERPLRRGRGALPVAPPDGAGEPRGGARAPPALRTVPPVGQGDPGRPGIREDPAPEPRAEDPVRLAPPAGPAFPGREEGPRRGSREGPGQPRGAPPDRGVPLRDARDRQGGCHAPEAGVARSRRPRRHLPPRAQLRRGAPARRGGEAPEGASGQAARAGGQGAGARAGGRSARLRGVPEEGLRRRGARSLRPASSTRRG